MFLIFLFEGVMWLHFVTKYCQNVEFVIKINDEVVLKLHELIRQIYWERKKFPTGSNPNRMIIGDVLDNPYVQRSKNPKW